MDTNNSPLQKLYLKPGELIVAEEPVIVSTVLGSCVSVTMYNKQQGVAAICHGMLPKGNNSNSFKYVDTSLRYMLKFFDQLGISREEMEVKLFGGADMFNRVDTAARNFTVGWQNILTARRYLEQSGINLKASDIGGLQGRKLIFNSDTGIVLVKRMSK